MRFCARDFSIGISNAKRTMPKYEKFSRPFYEYSGRLTAEEQKRFSEFADSIMDFELSLAKKYALPKRERLQLEAHNMMLYRNNPELVVCPV